MVTKEKIGLSGAVFILIGYVIGASIFILPGLLGASTGPGLFISYVIAAIPAIMGANIVIQIGVTYPKEGGNFEIVKDTISPIAGQVLILLLILLAVIGLPLIALGFSDYLSFFYSGLERKTIAIGIILLFVLVNIFGIKFVSMIQGFLVVVFILMLLSFGIGGVFFGKLSQLQPLLPNGFEPVVIAAITLYFSYSGVTVLPEIASEIEQPKKNIPRAIIIGFFIIIAIYILVSLALVMTVDWKELNSTLSLITAAKTFFPKWAVNLMVVCALFAAATSISGVLLAQSRDVLIASKNNYIPKIFSYQTEGKKTPVLAIIFLGILSIAVLFTNADVKDYANMMVMGLMVVQILLGASVIMLPKKSMNLDEEALAYLNNYWSFSLSVSLIIFSFLMLIQLVILYIKMFILLILYLVASLLVGYFLRRK